MIKNIMNLFSKKKKPNATLRTDNLVLEFDRENEWWSFDFQGVDFVTFGIDLVLPNRDQLKGILEIIQDIEQEMLTRIESGMKERKYHFRGREDLEYTIDVANYLKDSSFEVTWTIPKSGDLGIDFGITNGIIISERWGD